MNSWFIHPCNRIYHFVHQIIIYSRGVTCADTWNTTCIHSQENSTGNELVKILDHGWNESLCIVVRTVHRMFAVWCRFACRRRATMPQSKMEFHKILTQRRIKAPCLMYLPLNYEWMKQNFIEFNRKIEDDNAPDTSTSIVWKTEIQF